MLATEDEAQTKWCPAVRGAEGQSDNNSCNRNLPFNGHPDAFALCIASRCMWWRWGEDRLVPPEKPLQAVPDGPGRMKAIQAGPTLVAQGYCGAAGRP